MHRLPCIDSTVCDCALTADHTGCSRGDHHAQHHLRVQADRCVPGAPRSRHRGCPAFTPPGWQVFRSAGVGTTARPVTATTRSATTTSRQSGWERPLTWAVSTTSDRTEAPPSMETSAATCRPSITAASGTVLLYSTTVACGVPQPQPGICLLQVLPGSGVTVCDGDRQRGVRRQVCWLPAELRPQLHNHEQRENALTPCNHRAWTHVTNTCETRPPVFQVLAFVNQNHFSPGAMLSGQTCAGNTGSAVYNAGPAVGPDRAAFEFEKNIVYWEQGPLLGGGTSLFVSSFGSNLYFDPTDPIGRRLNDTGFPCPQSQGPVDPVS